MRHRGTLFTVAVICACTAHDCGTHAQTADISIDVSRSALVVAPIEVNGGAPRRFVVDTGATTTTLDAGFASVLGLVPTGTLRVVTTNGAFAVPSGIIGALRIGAFEIQRLPVSWIPLAALRSEDDRIMGVIGQDVLSRTTMTIDYARRRLRLDPGPCAAAGEMTVPVARADARPTIAAQVRGPGGVREVRLAIDSAANALILFNSAGRAPWPATGIIRVATHADDRPASVIPRAIVTIAGVAFARPAVVISLAEPRGEDGLLPASWFSRVCLDGPGGSAVLTR